MHCIALQYIATQGKGAYLKNEFERPGDELPGATQHPGEGLESWESLLERVNYLQGIGRFKLKPKRGIAFFIEHGFVSKNAQVEMNSKDQLFNY